MKNLTLKDRKTSKVKGFALTQVLLAVALGASVSIGVVSYYNYTARTQQTNLISDKVVQNAEKSKTESAVGLVQNNNMS